MKDNVHIIALLGMPGSGKTEAIAYLMEKYQWPKVYFGQITIDEVMRRELPLSPENERIVREDLRQRFGKEYYAIKVMEKIASLKDAPTILLESLYSWTEYKLLKAEYGERLSIISIHASPSVRYGRLSHRAHRPLTKEEAVARDYAQLEVLEQGGPITLADQVIVNEGSVEELHSALDVLMKEYGYERG